MYGTNLNNERIKLNFDIRKAYYDKLARHGNVLYCNNV